MDDPTQNLVMVSVCDPGIDREHSDIVAYAGSKAEPGSRDLSLVRPLPGAFLREVVLRPLRFNEMAAVSDAPSSNAAVLIAFRFAVVEIRNAFSRGQSLKPTKLHRQADGTDRRLWGEQDLQEIMDLFGWDFMVEVADVAITRARQGKAWGAPVSYTLPDLCTLALQRISVQLAARARKLEHLERIAKSASEPTPSAEASAPNSDEGTAAPATAGM